MLTKTFKLEKEKKYLHFPIKNTKGVYTEDKEYRYVKFMDGEKLISEVYIKLSDKPDFYAPRYFGGYDKVTLVCEDCDVPDNYFNGVIAGRCMFEEKELYKNLYSEKYRNQFHFSPARGWLNDPNGLVFADGKYHMYFQHNPLGTVHGGVNISWGHAESADGVLWKEKNPAIYNENAEQEIASGSSWCDEKNIFGLGKNVLISAHTRLNGCYFKEGEKPQTEGQYLMYSRNGGETFENIGKNPKIPVPKGEFWRDPKILVIDKTMFMLVYETYEQKDCVSVYSSENLNDWIFRTRLPNLYECPDLFKLYVEETGEEKWVLYGGNGAYSICEFDSEKFNLQKSGDGGFLDYGWAVYAGQSFNNHPDNKRRYHLAWVVHGWDNDFADYKGKAFSQCMSLTCGLELHKTGKGYRLFRKPSEEIKKLRYSGVSEKMHIKKEKVLNLETPCEIIINFKDKKDFSFNLGNCRFSYNDRENKIKVCGFSFSYNKEKEKLEVVENSSKNKEYILSETDGIKLDVFVDKTVTEVFINEEISVTAVGLNEREKLKIISDEANIDCTLYKLKSIRD